MEAEGARHGGGARAMGAEGAQRRARNGFLGLLLRRDARVERTSGARGVWRREGGGPPRI